MGSLRFLAAIAAVMLCGSAFAQLEPFKDYSVEEAVWSITTIKVDANMSDYYLEGLRDSWVSSNEVGKELGQIEDYFIMVSDLPESGEFNMVLGVKYKNNAAMEPSEKEYDRFMKAWGKANEGKSRELVKTYPDLRTITGEYRLRNIKMK